MKTIIRNAKPNDYDTVKRIWKQVQQLHVEWRPDIYKSNDDVLSKDIFKENIEQQTLFVADYENQIVGVFEIKYMNIESPVNVTRDIIYIDTIAVDEAYRGKGIGRQMITYIKELKNSKGYDAIELQVYAKNKLAYEMYSKCGFTKKAIRMELLD